MAFFLIVFWINFKSLNLGLGNFYRGIDPKLGIKYFKKSIAIDENYAPPYNLLGYVYMYQMENYKEAEKVLKTYIKLVPDSPNGYDSYAELLLKMGRYDESIEQFKKANEKDENKLFGLPGIGHNYVLKGEYSKARDYYKKMFDKTTRNTQKLNMLRFMASSYIVENKLDDAMKKFDEYRAFAEKQNMNANIINSYTFQGFTLCE